MHNNSINHKNHNFLESDWPINPPIRALIGHLHVIGHLQSEIVILMIKLVMALRVVRCRSVIIRVINKLDSRFAVVQFRNHSYDYRPNRTPLSPITIIKNDIGIILIFITFGGSPQAWAQVLYTPVPLNVGAVV